MSMNITFVLYESPFRIIKLLKNIMETDPERRVMVARELTKMHEETMTCSAAEAFSNLSQRQSVKGEFCIIVYYNSNDRNDEE